MHVENVCTPIQLITHCVDSVLRQITTNSVSLHFGALDSASDFGELTQCIASIVVGPDAKSELVENSPYNNNMDVLYPLSAVSNSQ